MRTNLGQIDQFFLKSKKSKKTLIFLRKKLYNNGEIEYKEIVNFM